MFQNQMQQEIDSKKLLGIQDYELLSNYGTIGLYEECELTHIFLMEKNNHLLHHYFAVLSFEEFTENDHKNQQKFLTPRNTKINNNFELGILQKRITLENAKDIFAQLCNKNLNLDDQFFSLHKDFQLLPKTQIPSLWGGNPSFISKILKQNIWGDNYILEFSALANPFETLLTKDDLLRTNELIMKFIKINLKDVYDRIGSFIFQFPITLVSSSEKRNDDFTSCNIVLKKHQCINSEHLLTQVTTKLDDNITGYASYIGDFGNKDFIIGDSNNFEIQISNLDNNIIYKNQKCHFIRSFHGNIFTNVTNSEPRYFMNAKDERSEIDLFSRDLFGLNNKIQNEYDTRTNSRIYFNKIINRSGRFQEFFSNERDQALNFIKEIINKESSNSEEIWLWDPFLNYNDIFETLYFVKYYNITFKCITSYRKYKNRNDEIETEESRSEKESFENFKKIQYHGILSNSNNLGINLEFRAVNENTGFDFHDRFLFFIPREIDTMPTVFSLGTSVNSLGKSHHLIQQTLDPRNIVHSFSTLWQQLDNEGSLIIKLPEALHEKHQ